jgi:hypothetical protein
MIDKTDKTDQSAQTEAAPPMTVDNVAHAVQEQLPLVSPKKPFTSVGTRLHNEATYRGIDWILNSTVGVTFAYWAARTKGGEKYFGKPISGFFKKILKPFLRNDKATEEGAKWGTMFAGIMAGGFAIIPPMMVMENKNVKKGVIRWLDEKIYGEQRVKEDPKFEEAYKRIDAEPEKNFTDGMSSRLIAIVPLITVASIPATNKPLIKYLYDPIGKVSHWAMTKIGIKPDKMLREGKLEHINGDPKTPKEFQNNWDFLHRTIGFDFGLTIFYSIFHEIAYKTLAAFGKSGKKAKKATEELKPALESALPAEAEKAAQAAKSGDAALWADRAPAPASAKRETPPATFQEAILQQSDAKGALLSV